MIVRSCMRKGISRSCAALKENTYCCPTRLFSHSAVARRGETTAQNHYELLEVPINATVGEIKKSFYRLSKTYHPDLHPNDSSAAQKFVRISEAYATLGSPEKKSRYDRDHLPRQRGSSDGGVRTGSYSSAATNTGPGARPASGLSRRRTRFQGPPPSFYRNGGWGSQTDKRAEHASRPSHTYEAGSDNTQEQKTGTHGPGMGPGGYSGGWDNDVPHFDQQAHHQTHSEIERTRHRARRKFSSERVSAVETEGDGGPSVLFNFVVIMGVLGTTFAISGLFMSAPEVKVPHKRNIERA